MSWVDVVAKWFERAAAFDRSVEARVERAGLLRCLFDDDAPPVLLGRFEIKGLVGKGGMGRVYEARDPKLARTVAIKVLHPGIGRDRLVREGQAMARINHPNVVQVFDVGKTPGGEVFVAMEFVEGVTIREWLAGDRTPDAIVGLFREAGRGLAAAHAAGVLHRDFKPANVLVTQAGVAKVTDFGLAASGSTERATAGTISGTPAYMAPEQRDGAAVGPAADQFAFCLALFEALHGIRPNVADGEDAVRAQLQRVRGPHVAALARGLHWNAGERWPSVEALVDALSPRPRRRRWIGSGVAAAAGLAALAVVAVPRMPTLESPAPGLGGAIVAAAQRRTAAAYHEQGRYDDERASLEAAFAVARAAGLDGVAGEAAARLVFVTGVLLEDADAARTWTRSAESLLEGVPGAELAWARYHVGVGHLDREAARVHFEQALALRTDALGPEHPEVARVHLYIGNHYYERRNFESARDHLAIALELSEAAFEPDDPRLAMILDDLGNADQELGDLDLAQRRYERSLAIRRAQSASHPHLGTSWGNLGYLAWVRGDLPAAQRYYRLKVEAMERAFGPDSHRTAQALSSLAETLMATGDFGEAKDLLNRAIVIGEATRGAEDRDTVRYRSNLARVLRAEAKP